METPINHLHTTPSRRPRLFFNPPKRQPAQINFHKTLTLNCRGHLQLKNGTTSKINRINQTLHPRIK